MKSNSDKDELIKSLIFTTELAVIWFLLMSFCTTSSRLVARKHIEWLQKFAREQQKTVNSMPRGCFVNFSETLLFPLDVCVWCWPLKKQSWGYESNICEIDTHNSMTWNFLSLLSLLHLGIPQYNLQLWLSIEEKKKTTSQGWKRSFHTLRPFYCQHWRPDERINWAEEEERGKKQGKIRVGNFMVVFGFSHMFVYVSSLLSVGLLYRTIRFLIRRRHRMKYLPDTTQSVCI